MLEEVGIDTAAGEHADRAVESARVVTRALECLPGAFEEDPVLRIRQLRLARIHCEEFGIELLDALENGPRLDEVGLPPHLIAETVLQLRLAEVSDGLHAVAQIPPELFDSTCSGETAGHPNDRNPVVFATHTIPNSVVQRRTCALRPMRCTNSARHAFSECAYARVLEHLNDR